MYMLEFFVIGIPSFFLALQPNKNRIKGDYLECDVEETEEDTEEEF